VSTAVGVVINRTMAEEVWPGENPLGKRFSFSDNPPNWLSVVGVVGDTRQWSPAQPPIAQAYFPFRQGWSSSGYVVARVAGDPAALAGQVRRAALAVDPTQPPSDIRVMGERLESSLAQRRFYTTLIALFALAALFLASAGIYGTVSYFVTRRFRELGIRMALGAGGSGIVGLVLRRGARLALWGVGLGLLGVWGSTSIVESFVYGVAARDVPTLAGGCLVLAAVALAASALPAVRAARVHPVVALRSE
ncbi:MAG TPA: FtsX-like permease family protein, partial [Longimicrobiales bacterium]|nr:FtsX-like permease family protein [Longimicrobiales bacterium]